MRIIYQNKYTFVFMHFSVARKNIGLDINEILFHSILHGQDKQECLQGFYFEDVHFFKLVNMFEHTYMAESIHEGIVHFLPNK